MFGLMTRLVARRGRRSIEPKMASQGDEFVRGKIRQGAKARTISRKKEHNEKVNNKRKINMNVKELVFRKGKKLKLVVVGVWSVVRKTQRLPNSGILLFGLRRDYT